MAKGLKVESDALVEAGLTLMRQNGKELTKRPSKGRSMLYTLANGETVRVRTSNDHNLITVADSTDADAHLNIEGTDWLLLVVPEKARTPGKVIAYLLPTAEAVAEVRKSHQAWLATNPNTRGGNKTWVLWLRAEGPSTSSGYAEKWARYRLPGHASTAAMHASASAAEPASTSDIRAQVEAARQKIAAAAGVSVDAVRITIDFGVSA